MGRSRERTLFAVPRPPWVRCSLPFEHRPMPRKAEGGRTPELPWVRVGGGRMHPSRGVSLLLLLPLLVSCAGPAKLAHQSERALREGDLQKAYDLARRAVDKDPEHAGARTAMTAAAAQLADGSKARVLQLAGGDTLAAARAALDFRDFRGELTRYQVELPQDPGYFQREDAIVEGAAGIEYRRGGGEVAARRPKAAYRRFRAAATYDESYRDLQERLRQSHEQAMTRVALLPFENDVGIPGLSRGLEDAVYRGVSDRLKRDGLEFTELVSPDEVYATMTVKELDALPPEAMWRVAQGVEAARIVTGRVHGMRTNTNTFSFQYPIYRQVTARDTAGRAITHWVESRFDAVARERVVTVQWEVQVFDTRTHAELAKHADEEQSVARVAWTDYRAEGSCDDYRLVPPDQDAGENGRRVSARWKECFGSWTLPEMLEQARRDRGRSLYQSRYRDEFRSDSRGHPVLCGELPGENDLVQLSLGDLWQPVLATLKDLDPKD